jgi:ectoine hydroxylase-related dioxygenase (phytanoyl-CoA dioxygenase family)
MLLENVKKHQQHFEDSDYGICSTTDLNKPNLVSEISDFVIPLLSPIVNEYFENYQLILGNYLIKKPQKNTHIPIHQDWTFVDEEQFFSLSIWCPLIDVDQNNGCLQVVPCSHRMSKNIRPAPKYPNCFANVYDEVKKNLLTLPLRAGEAIFYDHALLHASPVNNSQTKRPAVILGLTHKDALLRHYFARDFKNNDQEAIIDEYDMPNNFFMDHIRGCAPRSSVLLNSFGYKFNPIKKRDFFSKINPS